MSDSILSAFRDFEKKIGGRLFNLDEKVASLEAQMMSPGFKPTQKAETFKSPGSIITEHENYLASLVSG